MPQLFYSDRRPIPPTWASYVALAVSVAIYWFAIALWIDRRFIQRKRPSHSGVVRIIMGVTLVLTALFFVLFLGKDLLGGWPEGPQGAYGVTAWLALASTLLLTELKGLRRRPASTSEL